MGAGLALGLRALGAALALPLGAWSARLLLGLVGGAWLALKTGDLTLPDLVPALAELLLGISLGLLGGLPARFAGALKGEQLPESFALLGTTFAWGVFFAVGGPALFLGGLAASNAALAAGAWPDAAALAGAAGPLFAVALVLGLPGAVVTLAVGPLTAWASRVGGEGLADGLGRSLAPLLVVLLWVALLPLALDWITDAWWAGLGGAGG